MLNQMTTLPADLFQPHFANGIPYTLGLLDTSYLVPLTGYLDNGLTYTVFVPSVAIPKQIHQDPSFLAGCQSGYECYDEIPVSFISICNFLSRMLCNFLRRMLDEELREPDVDVPAYWWIVGYALGWLSGVAKMHSDIAHVGMMHLCFLLTYVPASCLENRRSLYRGLYQADFHHTLAMKAYRARVRALAHQGIELQTAYQQALVCYTANVEQALSSQKPAKGVAIPFLARDNRER